MMKQSENEYDKLSQMRLKLMCDAALEAGDYILEADDRQQTNKTNKKDFVTIADIKSQDMLRKILSDKYGDVLILSEEDSEEERSALLAKDFTGFVLDPIDGTFNYKRDLRESAISIGYIEEGNIAQGVVFDPYKKELFHATLGEGAFCNGAPISVRQNYRGLDGASVATSNSYDAAAMRRNLDRQDAIYDTTGIMPWLSLHGSGVIIMTNVACGRFDAYHHNGLKPWDNAAAFLIVREAGGVVQTLDGEDAVFTSQTVLMGTPSAVTDLRTVFDQVEPVLLT